MKALIDTLYQERWLDEEALRRILRITDPEELEYLFEKAREARDSVYGKAVYLRGLIEFSNYCKNNCLYCGIRRDNREAERYRLSKKEILSCTRYGYALGFRSFVLQGGEDPYFTDERLVEIVSEIKVQHPDCALTLSVGEKSRESYQKFFDAGADRYLLRHETANRTHYALLHPPEMSFDTRLSCLKALQEIGYQTGCGMMVGSPGQTEDYLIEDLKLIHDFKPQMVGVGPFIPHHASPFAQEKPGSVLMSLKLLAMIRLILPNVLLPATTALGTADRDGRERGILAGANVIMPNLSPQGVRNKYLLYDNKLNTGLEAAEGYSALKLSMEKIGYHVVVDRGDWKEIAVKL